ncbi:MAG: UDP-3-O-(3-hydroxymyristoyl)glucosamine N-acyltransferase [Candidatus Omnitrophota bacterium]|nr:UDP-3-O-(3-hydroxymyristoyl)glucosamine N-acyltransferase [Candidatus Omnitrophota bacterium]
MFTVNDIVKFTGGTVIGDGKVPISGISSCVFAEEGDITFAQDDKGLEEAKKSNASCVITTAETENYPKTVLRVDDLKKALTMLYNAMLELSPPKKGDIHPSAVIAESARLGDNVSIGPYAVIEEDAFISDNAAIGANCFIGNGVTVGRNARVYPNVVLYEHTVLGNDVTIHAGTVIGADGFGYIPKDGKIYKVPQMGNVIIEDGVEIGANVCIDRGTFDKTVIEKGSKIDNLVQIAHNVKLGKNVLIAAFSGVAGSVTIGENTMIGGQVGIAEHVNIGKNVKLGARAGVSGTVEDGKVLLRNPARSPSDVRKLDGLLCLLIKHSDKFKAFLRKLPGR